MHSIKRALQTPLALLLFCAALVLLPVIVCAEPTLQYSWSMDTNPGWTTEGDWAFGKPTGGGGGFGNPDPTSGYTGDNVYGYNLSAITERTSPSSISPPRPLTARACRR